MLQLSVFFLFTLFAVTEYLVINSMKSGRKFGEPIILIAGLLALFWCVLYLKGEVSFQNVMYILSVMNAVALCGLCFFKGVHMLVIRWLRSMSRSNKASSNICFPAE